MKNILKYFNYLGSLWFVLLYGSALYVFIVTGKVPVNSNPDPKSIMNIFEVIYFLFNLSFYIMLFNIPLNIVISYRQSKNKESNNKWNVASYVFAFCLVWFIVILAKDPGGIFNWFMD